MKASRILSLFALLIALFCDHVTLGQNKQNLIRVTGTVTHPETGAPILARVYFEKIPYYDDMGVADTNPSNGVYELFMIENEKYILSVKANAFKTISEEIVITDNGIGLIEKNFKMEPDELHEIITLDNLIFARGRAEITEESFEELDEFANWLSSRPTINIQLEGHTDFQGNAEANMQLSEDRVLAVQDYLTKKGVKKSRIQTKAFGGTQPLTRERTPEARIKNRRVEVRILQQ